MDDSSVGAEGAACSPAHPHLPLIRREAWGAVVGHVEVFDSALIDALHVLDGLMRSPRSLAAFLEACGKVALERAGAILAARVGVEG